MDEILGNRPIATAENSGVDVGFEDEQEQLPDDQESDATFDLTDAVTPMSTASNATSGSGSLDLEREDDDSVDDNTDAENGPPTQPSVATAPPQSTQPSNPTEATPSRISK
ncbi:unnamed protein product [Leuciscus chuanchicus]